MSPPAQRSADRPGFVRARPRFRLLGLSREDAIRAFFGGNALMAVVILALITVFLFREGASFFGQNRANLDTYRKAGLEYVDLIRAQEADHTALTRYLSDLRLRRYRHLTETGGLSSEQAFAALSGFDDYAGEFSDAVIDLRGLIADLSDLASATKTRFLVNEDRREQRRQLLAARRVAEAEEIRIEPVDFATGARVLQDTLPYWRELAGALAERIRALVVEVPVAETPELAARVERFRELALRYVEGFPTIEERLAAWDPERPVAFGESLTAFAFGRDWTTASFWQDWYGILPLLTGSLLVSTIALFFAVPMGVGAAIYVNQLARPAEQRFIKPCIEFIAAIPSVVLGFFGIAVLGETLRALSGIEALAWIPGFPFSERLNALTAGALLALIAIPTIFTLAEDALNNVPRAFKEASFAVGATRLQTIARITVPAALSGIVSAVLLGLGRVIGETMVVLLCAGNRIAIPDLTAGLAVFTQPVHTMTGIIAQEMGEVVRGSIHYRALFCVGIVLFFLSLLINYFAQKIVRRYRLAQS